MVRHANRVCNGNVTLPRFFFRAGLLEGRLRQRPSAPARSSGSDFRSIEIFGNILTVRDVHEKGAKCGPGVVSLTGRSAHPGNNDAYIDPQPLVY